MLGANLASPREAAEPTTPREPLELSAETLATTLRRRIEFALHDPRFCWTGDKVQHGPIRLPPAAG